MLLHALIHVTSCLVSSGLGSGYTALNDILMGVQKSRKRTEEQR